MKGWFKSLWQVFAQRAASDVPVTSFGVPVASAVGAIARTIETFESPPQAEPAAMKVPAVPDAASPLNAAQGFYRARRLDDALAVLNRIQAASPEWGQAQYLKANVLSLLSRLDEAVLAAGSAVDCSETAASRSLQGWLLLRLGRQAEAERPLIRAAELGSKDIRTYLNLGHLLHAQERSAEAVTAIRRGLAIKPDEPTLVAQLGRYLLAAGQPGEAADVLAKAAISQADNPIVHLFRSWALRASGDVAGAVASLRRAIELDGDRSEWKGQLALLEAAQKVTAVRASHKKAGPSAADV